MQPKQLKKPEGEKDGATILVELVVHSIGHIAKRMVHHPLKGLLWLVWIIAIPVVMRLYFWQGGPARGYGYTPDPWYTDAALTARLPGAIGALGVSLLVVIVLDNVYRGPLTLSWGDLRPTKVHARKAARAQAKLPPPPPPPMFGRADLVLGIPYTPHDDAQWNPDRARFDEALQRDRRFALIAREVRLNTLLIAPQDTGKTEIIKTYIRWLVRNHHNQIVTDSKWDDYQELGEKYATHIIDLDDIANSHKLCIWDTRAPTPRKKAELLAEAILPDPGAEVGGAAHYYALNSRSALGIICEVFVAAHTLTTPTRTIPGRMPTLREIYKILMTLETRTQLREKLPPDSDLRDSMNELDAMCKDKDVIGGLRLAVGTMITELGELLVGEDEGGYAVSELMNGRGIFVWLRVSIAHHTEAAPILVRLLIQQYTNAILSPHVRKDVIKIFIIDEARHFVMKAIATGQAQGRSNWGCYLQAYQDTDQITNPTLRTDILGTAMIKILLSSLSAKDAKLFEETFGAPKRPTKSQSIGYSTGYTAGTNTGNSQSSPAFAPSGSHAASRQRGRSVGESESTSQGESLSMQPQANWEAYELRTLPAAHALIEWRPSRDPQMPADPVRQLKVKLDLAAVRAAETAQGMLLVPPAQRAPLTSMASTRVATRQHARRELEKAIDQWRVWRAEPPQDDEARRQATIAELLVRFFDAQLLACETDNSAGLEEAAQFKAQADQLQRASRAAQAQVASPPPAPAGTARPTEAAPPRKMTPQLDLAEGEL